MWVTALIMGLAGSLHCAGMCSPLAMAVTNLTPRATLSRLLYNTGRILTYGILGLGAGSAGSVFSFASYQNILSITMGIILLMISFFGISSVNIPFVSKMMAVITLRIKVIFSVFFQRKNFASVLAMGLLNGFLPCGLTFISLGYAATLGNAGTGMLHMIFFGIGTLPVMLGFTAFFQYLVKRFNLDFRRVTTGMLFLSGCVLIVRVFILHHGHTSPEEQKVVDIIMCR